MSTVQEIVRNFPENIPNLNESEVREEIVSPLLSALGYSAFGPNIIRRERQLRYPFKQHGRKKKGKDIKLTAKPDYELDAGPHHRAIIECKAVAHTITQDDIDQAYSYACHPEVRAVVFIVTNGSDWQIFYTGNAVPYEPAHRFSYSRLRNLPEEIAFLAPERIQSDYPLPTANYSVSLIEGKQFSELTGAGHMAIGEFELEIQGEPQDVSYILGHQTHISNARIRRDDDGRIQIFFDSLSANPHIAQFQNEFGWHEITAVSHDRFLSQDFDAPTLCTGSFNSIFESGTAMRNPESGEEFVTPFDMMILQQYEALVSVDDMTARFLFHSFGQLYVTNVGAIGAQRYTGLGQIFLSVPI